MMPASSPIFRGTPLRPEELELIRTGVAGFGHLNRAELAATVCQWLGWQRPNGRLKTRECRDLLQDLEALELLELPAPRAGRPRGKASRVPLNNSRFLILPRIRVPHLASHALALALGRVPVD